MKTNSTIKTAFLTLLLFSSVSYAQGILQAFISDSTTQEPLVGANVYFQGTAIGAATDLEGRCRITGIPSGQYNVRVSYLGYKTRVVQVEIIDHQTRVLNTALIPDVIEGNEVIITAQARGQVAAINQQLTSKTIVNVVSEEKIKELPDANAAEAIGRLPGVSLIRSGGEANKVILRGMADKFTNITIDGVKIPPTDADERGVDLSTLSQGSLAGIELFKALTPDKDADAIAGSVNLVTKKASSEGLFRLESKGNYNRLMNSLNQYDISGRFEQRFVNEIIGVQATGNIEQRIRSNESYDYSWAQGVGNNPDKYEISDFTVEFNDEIRTRNGGGILLDFNTPDNGSIKINNIYSLTKRSYLFSTRNYPYGAGNLLTYTARDQEQEINTFNSSVKGDNNFFGFNLTWGLSFAQSKSHFPYDYSLDFLESGGMSNLTPSLTSHPEELAKYANNRFDQAAMLNAYFRSEKNLDKERTAFVDLSHKFSIGDIASSEIKLGGKYKYKNRFKESGQLYAPYYLLYWRTFEKLPGDTVTRRKNFEGTRFQQVMDRFILSGGTARNAFVSDFLDNPPKSRDIFDLYSLYPILNRDAIRLWYDLNKYGVDSIGRSFEYYHDPTADADYYDINERVTSLYLMETFNIGQDFTFIAGVRMEREENDYKSRFAPSGIAGFPIASGVIKDTSASYTETIWLPNFHVTFQPLSFINVRLAAYRALARPDFNFRLNKGVARGFGGSTTLLVGNPGLKTAKAWNYELNTSFFGNEFGLISVSAFYKEIKDMFHLLNGVSTVGDTLVRLFNIDWRVDITGAYQLTLPYNSVKPTKVWGFEYEHQMNFNFFPGFLKNFVLSYNFSIVRSETHLFTSDTTSYWTKVYNPGFPPPFDSLNVKITNTVINEKKQKLEGQPEFYGNISLGYDYYDFSARVSLYYQDSFNDTFSANSEADGVVDSYTRIDVILKQKVTNYLSVIFSVSNLTDVSETKSIVNRIQRRTLPDKGERYGTTADLGIRLEF